MANLNLADGVSIPVYSGTTASLSGSVITYTTTKTLNLTSLGGTDWAAFGYNTNAASIQRKLTGGSIISALSQVGAVALLNFDNGAVTPHFSSTWTDGNPNTSISNEGYVVYSNGPALGAGLSFTVPAGQAVQTLTVYVSVSYNNSAFTQGKLTATLSDASAAPYVDTSVQMTNGSANLLGVYVITFSAASNSQTLTVAWVNNTSNAQNVQVYAATLNALTGPVALFAMTASGAAGRAAVSGRVPLQAVTKVRAAESASLNAALALVSRAGAFGRGVLDGFVGKVPLATKGSSFGAARLDGFAGKIPLQVTGKSLALAFVAISGKVPLIGRGSTLGTGRAAPTGLAALRAAANSIGSGRLDGFTGKTLLAAYSAAVGSARAAISVVTPIALLARSGSMAAGRAVLSGKLTLQFVGKSAAGIVGNSIAGRVSIAARSAAVAFGRATILTVPFVYLVAMSATRGFGRAATAGKLTLQSVGKSAGPTAAQFSGAINLRAFGIGRGTGRVSGAFRTSLQAVMAAVSAARLDGFAGRIALAARSASIAPARAAISTLVAGFVALVTISRSTTGGRAVSAGILKLSSRASAIGSGRVGLSGKIQFSTVSAVVAIARAIVTGKAGLASFSRGIAEGIGIPSGFVQLISRGPVSSRGYAAASLISGLVARSLGRGQAKAQLTGILTITATSPVRSTSVAKSSLLVPLATLSAVGRSVANSIALLFLKRPLFVDQRFIVKYPSPVRAMKYPHPIRMASGMPRSAEDFSTIYPTEQATLGFDFTTALSIFAPGETISTPTVSVVLVSGEDASPSARLIGVPSISGNFVLQSIGACQAGAVYDIIATTQTSGNQILTTNAHLSCQPIT
jgi:hypothetical protein